MKDLVLPATALWETIQSLTQGELKQVKGRLGRTRAGWLLRYLRQMKQYDEKRLYQAYRKAFPGTTDEAIRAQKKHLWQVLEEVLPLCGEGAWKKEVRIWHRLWLSTLLWRRGLSQSAEILWYQALSEAVSIGWLEAALWGFSLLEIHERDFHHLTQGQTLKDWGDQLIGLILQRYKAVLYKVEAAERHLCSRPKKGLRLPPLPSHDAWAAYLMHFSELYPACEEMDTERALRGLTAALEVLLKKKDIFPYPYTQHAMAMTYLNIGSFLLHTSAGMPFFESWYEGWMKGWQRGFWPQETLFSRAHSMVLSLRILYLIRKADWNGAWEAWEAHKEVLQPYIFTPREKLGSRAALAAAVYLLLLLRPEREREAIEWRLRVEPWLIQEVRQDPPYLRWVFLRWYEAYRSGDRLWTLHWYRKLRKTWAEPTFRRCSWWQPVLRALRGLTEASAPVRRRRLEQLLRRWETHPAEQKAWDYEATIFPMPLFIQSVLQRQPLEKMPPPSLLFALSPSLQESLRRVIARFAAAVACKERHGLEAF
ncbi:MAG: hypothetical protein NZ989_09215 [Bacteroidia bacterium]|nr:hypothetical protein [Bacteroidia bacterium]MDW8015714.1 hypothetical protein [Bacteroidia bacterium]